MVGGPAALCLILSIALTACCATVSPAQSELTPEELTAEYSRLRTQRFYRHSSAIYDAALRYSQMDPEKIRFSDQFMRDYFDGRWDAVRTSLGLLSESQARDTYSRMLNELSGRNIPVMSLDDFLGLADAAPEKFTSDQIRKLGIVLRIAVPKEQEIWLRQALKKGTRQLGTGGAKRLVTGRILMHADFDDLAREYLPDVQGVAEIEDEAVREEILQFLASQEELEQFQRMQISATWEKQQELLTNPASDNSAKQQAADKLAELLGRAPLATLEPWLRSLSQKNMPATLQLASALGKRAENKLGDRDADRRTNNLYAQQLILQLISEEASLGEPPWIHIATAMANSWIQEADHTYNTQTSETSYIRGKPHVEPGDLVDSSPADAWAEALPKTLREQCDICCAKAIVISNSLDDAVDRIVEIAKRNPDAGVSLAEQYLEAWARQHDPQVPEEVRKQYQLPTDARIVVTPVMMEKNIDRLAEIMDLFRQADVHPRNAQRLIDAFDICYSNAEVYRQTHIEKVFGSIDRMDEEIFYHMIQTMIQGLSTRWRNMEIQAESGTNRTQEETLAMVREGYRTALEMIDRRTQADPKAWKILTLAGSLCSDWADFEYYQRLVDDAMTDRMTAFQDLNTRAEQYFTRGSEAYASQVPKLSVGQYSIEPYLAWFRSVLGINSSGSLNLSKPLDRRALEKIRDLMHDLPGGAGKAHINKLAKYVATRLEDAEHPLHEELKYKYLAGSLVITADSPFSFQANSKVAYYDELLDEIRLETRVDGPNTINRDHEFGIILSVYHTEAMGRMAEFGRYLTNDPPTSQYAPSTRTQSIVTTYRMGEAQGPRDELEMNIREALGLFFTVKSVTFSPKDVAPRSSERPGWEETVLAYIQVQAKDCSVDKIPRIQMNLEFLDLTGPVSISAESAETMIKVTDQPTPPRPFAHVDMTQTLDARNLAASEEVLLEISASSQGLLPELETLVDLDAIERQLPVIRIDPHGGLLVRQINSWSDTVHAVSERQWTVVLDGSALLDPPKRIDFKLPAVESEDAVVQCQAYQDEDLLDLDEPAATIGEGPTTIATLASPRQLDPWILSLTSFAGGLGLLFIGAIVWRLARGPRERPLRARDVFHMPDPIDPFVVVQLLRSLTSSELVRLTTRQRAEMEADINRIQETCFHGNAVSYSEGDLTKITKKWLRIAC